MNALEDDGYCFACGKNNPIGLRMEVRYEPDRAYCRVVLGREYQGWVNVVHGGILSTLLDEIMAHAVLHHVGKGVTARLGVRFRSAAPINEPLEVTGWIHARKGKLVEARGEIRVGETHALIAEAESRFVLSSPDPALRTP